LRGQVKVKIYKIVNKNNGKIYVGKTNRSLEERFSGHIKSAKNKVNRYLYDSMNHHGYHSFEIIEIETCNSDEQLNEREKFWIKELNSLYPNGYNMTEGGDGGNTLKSWSEEERKLLYKMQGNKRRGKRPPEFSQTMSEASKKRELEKSEEKKKEVSQKISKTLKEKYSSGEIKAVTPVFHGKEHPGFIDVDINVVLDMIRDCKTLTYISDFLSLSKHAIRSRLVEQTGKNFLEWRREYGIEGPLSKPRRTS
jgi:group I intron endonuclease